MARILVGVTGGISAYKAVELVRLLTKAGHAVRVVQTPGSLHFVGRATFDGITGAPVLVDEFEPDPARGAYPGDPEPEHAPISHLELVRRADAYVIAPATANTIAKLANGLADNMLTSAALANSAPLLIAPAMNDKMFEHPATQANLAKLAERGARVIPPAVGALASKGEFGVGRLAEPPDIAAAIEEALQTGFTPRSLDGLRVLVTSGGTREPIDAVRYVGNRSSGRMGFALAEEARRRGAEVTVVAANVSLQRADGIHYIDVQTAAELEKATTEAFTSSDVLLMAAAVADFRPAHPEQSKISKTGREGLTVELEPTTDVLASLAAKRKLGQTIVGFAAEHGEGAAERAREKLVRKGVDAIVLNDVSQPGIGFDSRENEVSIVTRDGVQEVPKALKTDVARAIIEVVEKIHSEANREVKA
jgi:phosphopantothenoylcysteine decarboxylase/phosphopantothenate--cysteine ligase